MMSDPEIEANRVLFKHTTELSDENIQNLIKDLKHRREFIGTHMKGYCTVCRKQSEYIQSDIMTGATECEDCYKKRKIEEITSTIENVKAVKLQNVREYFKTKRALNQSSLNQSSLNQRGLV